MSKRDITDRTKFIRQIQTVEETFYLSKLINVVLVIN